MLIYHGSHVEVRSPKILLSGRKGDFGHGFYTTSSQKQARRWAQIRATQEKVSVGVVTVYEMDDSLLEKSVLQILSFEKADDRWLDFVLKNRRDPEFVHSYDIVAGPVADDRVYACLNALENGFADRKSILYQLKTYVLSEQILFYTTKALLFLRYKDTEVVPCSQK